MPGGHAISMTWGVGGEGWGVETCSAVCRSRKHQRVAYTRWTEAFRRGDASLHRQRWRGSPTYPSSWRRPGTHISDHRISPRVSCCPVASADELIVDVRDVVGLGGVELFRSERGSIAVSGIDRENCSLLGPGLAPQ